MNKKLLLAGGAAVVLTAAAVLFLRLRPTSFPRLAGDATYNVVLITVDTLRADRIGCYGLAGAETPTMDAFAAGGVRFENCSSATPLTLPSHTTILTGTLPPFHGVRDNGGFIAPAELVTIAEAYKERGFATAAFVGAYVLDSKWGLNQGFDYYFDQFDLSRFEKISLGNVQRPGNEVMDEALRWLEGKAGAETPFFAWVHLYDPHTPYEPPPPYRERYAKHPYQGEIAYTDTQLARLWSFLDERNLRERTYLVFASDHGESLGEHQETTHGFFVYEESVHVPLIVVTPFRPLQGVVSPAVVSLADILPTLCEMSGFPAPARVQGSSLVPFFLDPDRPSERLAYAETFYPRFHYGWSELTSVRDGRYKIILSPEPELYDLAADPDEAANIIEKERAVFLALNERAAAFAAEAGRGGFELDYRKIDEETRAKLAALGYIGSFSDPSKLKGKRLASPRNKIGIFNELSRAREMGLEGDADQAIATIRAIIAEDPEISDAHFSLGNIYFRLRRFDDAIAAFRVALDKKPDDIFTVINIANSYLAMGRVPDAEKFVVDYLASGFSDSQLYFLLGNLNFMRKDYERAVSYLKQCLSLNSESASSYNLLGAIYTIQDSFDLARQNLDTARRLNPRLSTVNYNLALLHEKRGDAAGAAAAYREEIVHTPKHFRSLYNLSRLYRQSGEEDLELEMLRRCLEVDPDFPLTYFYLARIHLRRGQDYEEAVDLVKKGIDLKPEPAELPLGYFLLADLYNRLGNAALSAEYARKGEAAATDRAR